MEAGFESSAVGCWKRIGQQFCLSQVYFYGRHQT
jgi:hypothetical protein